MMDDAGELLRRMAPTSGSKRDDGGHDLKNRDFQVLGNHSVMPPLEY